VAFVNRLQLAKCEKTKELFGCNFIFNMEPPYIEYEVATEQLLKGNFVGTQRRSINEWTNAPTQRLVPSLSSEILGVTHTHNDWSSNATIKYALCFCILQHGLRRVRVHYAHDGQGLPRMRHLNI
jgi:hypothetical protein